MARCKITNINKEEFQNWFDSLGIMVKEFEGRVCCKGFVSNVRCRGHVSTMAYKLMLKEFNLPDGTFELVEVEPKTEKVIDNLSDLITDLTMSGADLNTLKEAVRFSRYLIDKCNDSIIEMGEFTNVLDLFYGMSENMQKAVIEIMKVTQEEK